MIPFDTALAFALSQEGGFVDDTRDPGGATNKGITLATYQQWMSDSSLGIADLLDMTDEDISALYGALYWNPVAGNSLLPAVALEVFDFAVNAGVRRSAMTLQQAVGATQDGSIGPLTLAAVAATDQTSLVGTLAQLRAAYYRSLTSLFPIYGHGWLNRTSACEAAAQVLLPAGPPCITGA